MGDAKGASSVAFGTFGKNGKGIMTNVMIALFTRNRFNHLALCLPWLMRSAPVSDFTFDVVAFDDNSDDPRIYEHLRQYCTGVVQAPLSNKNMNPQERIGDARARAVDLFRHGHHQYLLLLDSDILLTKAAIAEAVCDYHTIEKTFTIGAYTLHAFPRHFLETSHSVGRMLFSTLSLTGEAHVLFGRDALLTVGNHFGPFPGGLFDSQVAAILKARRNYWTRIYPAYQVQHLGLGLNASLCYPTGQPKWIMAPYLNHVTKQSIVVDGFNVVHYMDCVSQVGGLEAPAAYLRTMKGHA